jgi:N-formylglutamate amidohydrolase
MRYIALFCCFFCSALIIGQVQYGTNNYIEYHPGNLPIVISVAHGGYLEPSSILDRTCNNPTLVMDAFTIELAKQIDTSLFQLTGCHPHIIYCNLKRTKLDCNRNISDGACANADAETAWQEFHQFIEMAQATALVDHGERIFYVDLHGHGNPIQRLELGYLLYEDELELSDNTLNSASFIGYSSIQHMVSTNANGYSHVELLRGEKSLGTLFANNGFPAVPSMQDPFPGLTSNYFSGGYNTITHTSYNSGNLVDGIQMECNYTGVRNNYLNRKTFGDVFANVFNEYLNAHFNSVLSSNCGILEINETAEVELISVVPSLSDGSIPLVITNVEEGAVFSISSLSGFDILKGKLAQDGKLTLPQTIPAGYYIVSIQNERMSKQIRFCITK